MERLDEAIDQAIGMADAEGEFSGTGVLITGSVVTAGDARHLLKAEGVLMGSLLSFQVTPGMRQAGVEVLGMEAIVVALMTPVAISVGGVAPVLAVTVGIGLAVLCVLSRACSSGPARIHLGQCRAGSGDLRRVSWCRRCSSWV